MARKAVQKVMHITLDYHFVVQEVFRWLVMSFLF